MSYLPEELRHTHRNINAILKDDCVRGRSHQGGWSERGAMKEPFWERPQGTPASFRTDLLSSVA